MTHHEHQLARLAETTADGKREVASFELVQEWVDDGARDYRLRVDRPGPQAALSGRLTVEQISELLTAALNADAEDRARQGLPPRFEVLGP